MKQNDFKAFTLLIAAVYQKAFEEELMEMRQGKSQPLSWYIYETTGKMVSYKTLGNYLKAVFHQCPERINPSVETLAILVEFISGDSAAILEKTPAAVVWNNFKKAKLTATPAS